MLPSGFILILFMNIFKITFKKSSSKSKVHFLSYYSDYTITDHPILWVVSIGIACETN